MAKTEGFTKKVREETARMAQHCLQQMAGGLGSRFDRIANHRPFEEARQLSLKKQGTVLQQEVHGQPTMQIPLDEALVRFKAAQLFFALAAHRYVDAMVLAELDVPPKSASERADLLHGANEVVNFISMAGHGPVEQGYYSSDAVTLAGVYMENIIHWINTARSDGQLTRLVSRWAN